MGATAGRVPRIPSPELALDAEAATLDALVKLQLADVKVLSKQKGK